MSGTFLKSLALAALALGATLVPQTSQAYWHYHSGLEFRFHHPVDYHYWHRGGWRHEWHQGRLGWWWVVAGSWYFFNRPAYPYPSADVPPVIVEPAPVVSAPVASTWYYCRSSNSYYPYVSSCGEGWMQVAAAPTSP